MSDGRSVPDCSIAVVGLGAVLPGSTDIDGFWRTLLHGHDRITDVPVTHWLPEDHYDPDPAAPDKTYARRGGFLPEVEFDPIAFGLPPALLPATDTAQLLALVVARQALRDVRSLDGTDRDRIGVVLGSAAMELQSDMSTRLDRPLWLNALREAGVGETRAHEICERIAAQLPPIQEMTFPGSLANVVAGRIANRFDLRGINHTVDAACASSLAAVTAAVNELRLGRTDLMLTGGVDASNGIGAFVSFSKTPALSPSGRCRPFDADADGTMLGEGVAMLALKRLADAERDGDHVYAVIKGIGHSSDGHGAAIYAPTPSGQVRALRNTYAEAGYGPDTVTLMEAHGTGTKAGDHVELTALTEVFAAARDASRPWCALGSVKSQLGHTKAAAGAVGLLKSVLALHHGVLPPTINVDRPTAAITDGPSPFHVSTAARTWPAAPDHPRRASVSSFGFGGSNFHVTLQEYGGAARPPRCRAASTELVLFSADTPDRLVADLRSSSPQRALSAIARDSQTGFDPDSRVRLAVLADDIDDLGEKLSHAATLITQRPDAAFSSPRSLFYATGAADPGSIAFVFPGQGSQHVDMGASLAVQVPAAREVWDRFGTTDAARAAHPSSAFTPEQSAGQTAELTRTDRAQPALAMHSLALLAVLTELGVRPDLVAGHSFGELTALHVADAFDAATLVRLADTRGRLMHEIAAPGAMLVVAAGAAETERVAAGIADLWPANLNSPRQTVLSGTPAAIEAARQAFAEHDIITRPLNAAAGFHSPLVAPAADALCAALDDVEISAPAIPVYGNADAHVYPTDPAGTKDRIAAQLAAPVLFADQIEALHAAGARTFVEVGAGATLTRLIDDTLGGREHLAVPLDQKAKDGLSTLLTGLGRLAVGGVRLDFEALWRDHVVEADTEQPELTVTITGANQGRQYPPTGGTAALPAPNPDETPASAAAAPQPAAIPAPTAPRPAAAVPTASPPPAAPGPAAHAGSVADLLEIGRRSAEAHATYQRLMTEAHLEYLRFSESMFTGQHAPAPADLVPAPVPVTTPPRPVPTPAPVAAATPGAPIPVAPAGPAVPEPVVTQDLEQVLIEVVEERTGYPASVLRDDMDLEGDLGIDSIKRVEILGALRDRVNSDLDLTSLDPTLLGTARTLSDVRDLFESQLGGNPVRPAKTQPATQQAAVQPRQTKITRLEPRDVEAPLCGLALAELGVNVLGIVDGASGIAEPLVEELSRRGVNAVVADAPTDRGVVYLGGLAEVASVADAEAIQWAALRLARSCPGQGVFVTVADTGAQPDRAWLGGLAGLTATVAREFPDMSVKSLDCARAGRDRHALATLIADELTRGGPAQRVSLSAHGRRTVTHLAPTELPSTRTGRIGPDSVIAASGGARGICAAAVVELARSARPRLVLLGRTPLTDEPAELAAATDEPSLVRLLAQDAIGPAELTAARARAREVLATREIRATVQACATAGAQVRYISVDVRDAEAVAAALEQVRADWGPITGVVHAAGVLADRPLVEKTDEEADRVLGTKLDGLRSLLDATVHDPIDLLVLFSSVSGYYGNAGQSDYAMANATMDRVAVAEQSRRPGCLVRSLSWGPWLGGMVNATLAEQFQRNGVDVIPTADGAAAFVAELGIDGPAHVVLSAGGFLPEPELRATVTVNPSRQPWLLDHQPADTPVLPVAAGINWMLAAASAGHADPVLTELRVLRKVSVDQPTSVSVTVAGTEVTLRTDAEAPNFRARVRSAQSPRNWQPTGDPTTHHADHLYADGVLFHGPRLHALRSLGDLGEDGAVGLVLGAQELGWVTDDLYVDVPAVDGALQLAGVWAGRSLGQVLPMGMAECRVHRGGVLPGPALCVVGSGTVNAFGARCDIALLGPDGEVWVELLGVELVAVPERSR